ncbi:MAG: hypothetical protein ACRD0P_11900 [Stackebrandtia sp.]
MTEPQHPVPPAAGRPAPPSVPAPTPPGSNRRGHRLLIGGAVLVVLLVVGTVFLVTRSDSSAGTIASGSGKEQIFAIDDCVRPVDHDAVAIDCDDAKSGDYVIIDKVEDARDCSDQMQPVIKASAATFCLDPYED